MKATTIWMAFSNFEFSPQFSCCYSFCTVLRKLPSCPEYLVVITVLQVFSYYLVIITGRERDCRAYFYLASTVSPDLSFEKISLSSEVRGDAVRLMCSHCNSLVNRW